MTSDSAERTPASTALSPNQDSKGAEAGSTTTGPPADRTMEPRSARVLPRLLISLLIWLPALLLLWLVGGSAEQGPPAEAGVRRRGMDHGVPVVLEQKTTILRKCLYLLASLKDPSGLSVTYETKRSSEEENPVHRQNTTLNVDKIRSFRPPYAWMKTFGYSPENSPAIFIRGGEPWLMSYCWPTSFKVLGVLFLREVFSTFLPSTKACWTHKLRHFGVDQQYPLVYGH
jgi:hypothetical protein